MSVRGTSPISTSSGNSPTSREDRAGADSIVETLKKDHCKVINHGEEQIQAES